MSKWILGLSVLVLIISGCATMRKPKELEELEKLKMELAGLKQYISQMELQKKQESQSLQKLLNEQNILTQQLKKEIEELKKKLALYEKKPKLEEPKPVKEKEYIK